jgi:hypothetical protein
VVRLSAEGGLLWQKSYGGSRDDEAFAVAEAAGGGFLVVGRSESSDGDVTGNHGKADFWAARLSADGGLLWEASFGGTQNDRALSVTAASGGGFVIAGESWSSDGDVLGNRGENDFWIVKIAGDGAILWQKPLGGKSWDEAFAVIGPSSGGLAAAGRSASSDGDATETHGGGDMWVVRLDSGN